MLFSPMLGNFLRLVELSLYWRGVVNSGNYCRLFFAVVHLGAPFQNRLHIGNREENVCYLKNHKLRTLFIEEWDRSALPSQMKQHVVVGYSCGSPISVLRQVQTGVKYLLCSEESPGQLQSSLFVEQRTTLLSSPSYLQDPWTIHTIKKSHLLAEDRGSTGNILILLQPTFRRDLDPTVFSSLSKYSLSVFFPAGKTSLICVDPRTCVLSLFQSFHTCFLPSYHTGIKRLQKKISAISHFLPVFNPPMFLFKNLPQREELN